MDYNELFGLEDQGENEQEAAETADDEQESPEETEPEEVETEAEAETEEAGGKQTDEENAAYAAARRKAERERDMGIAKAKEDADRTISDFLKRSGTTNPYTGKPIETREQYEEYLKQFGEDQKKSFMEKSGVSEEEFEAFINGLPQVRAAREAEERARAENAKAQIDLQMKEINAMDARIKSIDDLTKMDTYPQFYEHVKRGASFVDAFKLANYDSLVNAAAKKTRQETMNAAAGKNHLSKTSTRGSGADEVPEDMKREYRKFIPGATDAEIQKHYQKYKNKK